MATNKKSGNSDSDPKIALASKIEAASKVLAKHKDKPLNDPKRRLASKKLKRSQRRLTRVVKMEAKAAEASKKTAAT